MFILLTQKEIEKFVTLINSGKNTYKDIHNEFPNLSDSTLIDLIGDDFETKNFIYLSNRISKKIPILIFFTKVPDNYSENYTFKDDDSFELSVHGENILYQIEKEYQSEQNTKEAIRWAKYATILTFIGLIYQFITSAKSSILNLLQSISGLMPLIFLLLFLFSKHHLLM